MLHIEASSNHVDNLKCPSEHSDRIVHDIAANKCDKGPAKRCVVSSHEASKDKEEHTRDVDAHFINDVLLSVQPMVPLSLIKTVR